MATYVLVHGAWHTGDLLEPVAAPIRKQGHTVHLPTLAGNALGDSKKASLDDAIASLTGYFDKHNISDAILMGHSYGGMVISGAADRLAPGRVRRLVYWNAFVPLDGESLNDMVPAGYVELFSQLEQPDGSVLLPYPIWREAFINDADEALAKRSYDVLNPHPNKTFKDKIKLSQPLAAMAIGKSYINCRSDTALPHSMTWHPRLSEKLGLFRYIECSGSHEICFTDPETLAQKIIEAGRD